MKRILIPSVMVLVLVFLSACGSSGPKEADYQWYDLYPKGLLTAEEREQREAIKQEAAESLPPEMRGDITSVSLKKHYVEVSVSYSDERIKSAPDDWAEILENTKAASGGIGDALQGNDDRPIVIYLTDSRRILLTAKDGDLLYNRFKKNERPKQREIPPEILAKIEAESIARIAKIQNEETGNSIDDPARMVYVSDSGGLIHSIPDCSGMENYERMTKSEAEKIGYLYCSNCW